jgi:tetratricopeptide (TPR) repeat protein
MIVAASCATAPPEGSPPAALPAAVVEIAHGNISFVAQRFATSPRDYRAVYDKVSALMHDREFSKAKELALDAVGTIDPASALKLPSVEDGTLYIYGDGWGEGKFPFAESNDWSLPTILDRLSASESDALQARLNPRIMDLHRKSPWEKVAFVYPVIPRLYYNLGYVAIEEHDTTAARGYLDQAIALWPDDLPAYSERQYLEVMTRDYSEAKRISLEGLERCIAPVADQARICRQLGYIASEELSFEQAENYYRRAMDLVPDDTAALNGIDNLKRAAGYGTLESGGLYRHGASRAAFPAAAGDFERVGVGYPDAASADVHYHMADYLLDAWADFHVAPRTSPVRDAGSGLLAAARGGLPDLEVLIDWHEDRFAAGGPPILHLAAASRSTSSHVQIWVAESGSWLVSCTAHYPAPSVLMFAEVHGGIQNMLERLVRSVDLPPANSP